MLFSPRAAILSACLLASGCATTADPHEGGFISGVVGTSGGYQKRVKAREAELARMRDEEAAALARARDANNAVASREHELTVLQADVAALDHIAQQEEQAVSNAQAGNSALAAQNRRTRTQLATARAQLAALRAQLQSAGGGADYEALRREYESVRTAMAVLGRQLLRGRK